MLIAGLFKLCVEAHAGVPKTASACKLCKTCSESRNLRGHKNPPLVGVYEYYLAKCFCYSFYSKMRSKQQPGTVLSILHFDISCSFLLRLKMKIQ